MAGDRGTRHFKRIEQCERLKDVSALLESLDGTEALIEGFGELSGRFRKSV